MSGRPELLARCFALETELSRIADAMEDGDLGELATFDAVQAELSALCDQYLDRLSEHALSRCPFTGEVLRWKIDLDGLDGLFWNRDAALRPPSRLPDTVHALTGALALSAPIESAPFTAAPGPGVPWLAPELLGAAGVRAVVSSVRVGRHPGWLIAYYLAPGAEPPDSLPDWGIDHCRRIDDSGEERWWQPDPLRSPPAFDLAPWIAQGRVLWIAPDDPGLRLRSALAGCPYLAMDGRREPGLVHEGTLWVGGRPVPEGAST